MQCERTQGASQTQEPISGSEQSRGGNNRHGVLSQAKVSVGITYQQIAGARWRRWKQTHQRKESLKSLQSMIVVQGYRYFQVHDRKIHL